MNSTMTFNEARTWATISNNIVPFYVPEADSYLVAWGKYILGHKQAVLIVSNSLYHMPITPAMKDEAFNEFKFVCAMSGLPIEFDISNYTSQSHYSWLTHCLNDQILSIRKSKDSENILKLLIE